jgi:hypothetical protein
LTDFACVLQRQPVSGGTPHQLQRLTYLAVRYQGEKGRLVKLKGESLLQRAVKDAVTGLIVEVGDDDRVLVGKAGRGVARAELQRSPDGRSHKEHGCRNKNPPAPL